jgi:ribonuclease Z
MCLRRPQPHADINFRLICKTFPLRTRRYIAYACERQLRQNNVIGRLVCTKICRSFYTQVDLARRGTDNIRQESYKTQVSHERAGRHGSLWSQDIGPKSEAKTTFSCRDIRRFFATGALSKTIQETPPKKTTFKPRSAVKMAPGGAAREMFYFQFITTPTADTSGTTLLLHFNNKRYIFGSISEGTQRACSQRGIGLKKLRHLFLTGKVQWANTGGLIGMILTMADGRAAEIEAEKLRSVTEAPQINGPDNLDPPSQQSHSLSEGRLTIHGGEKLIHTMACARRFVFRKGLPVSMNEFEFSNNANPEEPTWKDENVRIWAMPIAPSTATSAHGDNLESTEAATSSLETSPGSNKRKRSHDQFAQNHDRSTGQAGPNQHLQHQELRQRIVAEMFNSGWNRDALFEVPIAEVKMPAALFVRDPRTKKITTYHGPKPGDEEPLPDITVLVRDPWPGALIDDLPPARDIGFEPAMSYIVQGYPQRGKFDPQKAVALGVPRGPLYSSLATGNAVTLDNGTVVTPDMVLGPTKPGRGIVIVELPSNTYVENLISRLEWASEQIKDGIVAICWILGPGVASHAGLQEFIKSVPNVEHIISSMDVCPNYLALESSAASAIRLSRISRSYFPVPVHDNLTLPQLDTRTEKGAKAPPAFTAANRGLVIQVEPKFLISKDNIPPLLNTAEVVRNLPQKVDQYARLAREEAVAENHSTHGPDLPGHPSPLNFDPEIVTLGTGSAQPSKYRNVSATLLLTGKYGNFLFDCGENTMGQLRRVFDPPSLRDVLRNLKFIWISHLHADHHLGTVSVLAAQRSASVDYDQDNGDESVKKAPQPRQGIVVASEGKMLKFLEEYESVEPFRNIRQLLCQPSQGPVLEDEMASFLHQQLGIEGLQTTAVEHCSGAQAISVTFENGFKFSYSGDCRPSVPFATIGKGSDVLVHEATFDDDMEGDALAKKHCTTGEALGVAAKMEAKNVILTHFSQRYQKLPVMENLKLPSSTAGSANASTEDLPGFLAERGETQATTEGRPPTPDSKVVVETKTLLEMAGLDASISNAPKLDMNICVAFDYMRVRVSDIRHMSKFTPAFAALFEAEQKKPVENGTPQERSDMINRARGSKKSHQSTDVDKSKSQVTSVERAASQGSGGTAKEQTRDQKIEVDQDDNGSNSVQRVSGQKPDCGMVNPAVYHPAVDFIQASNIM